MSCPRIALTSGEPAGIGPDLAVLLAREEANCEIITLGDPELLTARAAQLCVPVIFSHVDPRLPPTPNRKGELKVMPFSTAVPVVTGKPDPKNAAYVLATLDAAIDGCLNRQFDAMVTAPVQKSVINEAGFPFTGHTEYLAERTGTPRVVMMLATTGLRVALATTHLPLREVADAITAPLLEEVIRIIHHDLKRYFGLHHPRILISGLNPHAGEGGHLGREEIETITPALEKLRREGIDLTGPLPADTLFTPKHLANADIVLAMYHDQGLPVLKHQGFGQAANITLGLPMIRTSVDHGTALDLAGSGKIDTGSLDTALRVALEMAKNHV